MIKKTLSIDVRGAREHNLKNISVSIPKNKLTVITGLSGSGKSSLAFDTIYAEGQRRYMDSLSNYARHFLEQLKKPDVDSIQGLSPSIAIDQKTISNSPRSTVGTVTEIYDFLRLLFAKVGTAHCPVHHLPVEGQLPEEIIKKVLALKKGTRIVIYATVARSKKGEFSKEFQKWSKLGFISARVDGEVVEINESLKLAKTKRHDIDLIIDKLFIESRFSVRIAESIHKAILHGDGNILIEDLDLKSSTHFSTHRACPKCGYSFSEIDPLLFSFNNPKGACETCLGLGTIDIIEYEEETLSKGDEMIRRKETKWKIKGEASDDDDSIEIVSLRDCEKCSGTGLKPDALNVFISEKNIVDLSNLSILALDKFFQSLRFNGYQQEISEKILSELKLRLNYLIVAGAGYLSLGRRTRTLSGGEAQRIRLASQVGAPLIGVLYVLDEPSIGLHPRDHKNILSLLHEIKNRGNTVLVVEHDEETILAADYVIDVGPGAGVKGGEILAAGSVQDILNSPSSLTGKYLSRKLLFPIPAERRSDFSSWIKLSGATANNLKNIDVDFPLGCLIAVSGVSGSGKSTLIMDTLLPHVLNSVSRIQYPAGNIRSMKGHDNIERALPINQKPIGRTPRSCPATYVGLFPLIRDLFANLPDAKMRGYKPGHFSFNVKGGRCEACQGAGMVRTSMHFLADSFVMCDVCAGRRYAQETLLIKYKEKNIADVLAMSVSEALPFFEHHPAIYKKLNFLNDVGLDYMTLGQSSTTLSGGEAQRIKLSRELSKQSSNRTLYVLDEPTTGLHTHDIAKLVQILHRLTEKGHTVIVIEHNLDLIFSADYIIDMGPEGGDGGGEVVAVGSPEDIIANKKSVTGIYLKQYRDQAAPQKKKSSADTVNVNY